MNIRQNDGNKNKDKILKTVRIILTAGLTFAGFWILRIREPFEMLAWLLAHVKQRKA